MSHDEAFALMMDALDHVLAPADRVRLDGHLSLCAECHNEWKALQVVDGLLAGAPMVSAPAGFGPRVRERLSVSPWRRTLGALFALGAGSIAVLMLVGTPAAMLLAGLWSVYNDPASFTEWIVWLNRLAGVSGSVLTGVWTAIRLFLVEVAADPIVLGWVLAAAFAVAIWAHLTRQPAPVAASNRFRH